VPKRDSKGKKLSQSEIESRSLDYSEFKGFIVKAKSSLDDSIKHLKLSSYFMDLAIKSGLSSRTNRYAMILERLHIKASRVVLGKILMGSTLLSSKLKKTESDFSDVEREVMDPGLLDR
jgi:hypothetical protein